MTKKELFNLYYPHLNWLEFELSDLWVEVCTLDLNQEVYVESEDLNINLLSQNELYTDNPGPVG